MFRTLVVLGFYSRRYWPEDAAVILDIPSGPKHTVGPVKPEEPLYNDEVSEYDPENMPAIPTSVGKTKKPITSPLTTLDPTRVALIIETRPLPILPAVL